MNMKALVAAILTVFVGFPLALLLIGLIAHFFMPLVIVAAIGGFVWIFYSLYCEFFEINS